MDPVRTSIAASLAEEEKTHFLAVLFRTARADDVSVVERDRLKPVLDWIDAGDKALEKAMQLAYDQTVGMRDLVRCVKGPRKGLLLASEACAVVWADSRKSPDEEELLDVVFSALALSDATRSILDSPLACSPEGERRFLELLESD